MLQRGRRSSIGGNKTGLGDCPFRDKLGRECASLAADRFHRSWDAERTSATLQVRHDAVLAADAVVSKQAQARNQMWTDRANRSLPERDGIRGRVPGNRQSRHPRPAGRRAGCRPRRDGSTLASGWSSSVSFGRRERPAPRGKHVPVSHATDEHERLEGWMAMRQGSLGRRASFALVAARC
jgi:hypothetical protein